MPVATQKIRAADDWEACETGHGILEAGTYPCAVDFIITDLQKVVIEDLQKNSIKLELIDPAFIDAIGDNGVLENSP